MKNKIKVGQYWITKDARNAIYVVKRIIKYKPHRFYLITLQVVKESDVCNYPFLRNNNYNNHLDKVPTTTYDVTKGQMYRNLKPLSKIKQALLMGERYEEKHKVI